MTPSTAVLPATAKSDLRSDETLSPELDELMRNAHRASDFLKALSHENRLLLLCLLAEGERSVSELETILSMRQSAVSQQLARLRLDGMVLARREGKAVFYSIASEEVRRMIAVVYDIFCGGRPKPSAGRFGPRS